MSGALAAVARFAPRLARRSTAVAAAVLVAVAALAVASRSTLWDRDEARFARAAVEMVDSGNLLVPTFNGALRPDKPILVYWLMAATVRIGGPSELAVRFWAPWALAAVFLLTAELGRKLASATTGLLAGAIVVTTPLALVTGTAATTDALLLAFSTLALGTFANAFLGRWRAVHGLVLTVALAGGMLTKGPVGLAVPLLSLATAAWLGRRESPLGWRHAGWIVLATACAVALFLAWAVPANEATGGEFARLGLGRHVVDRSLTPLESHGGSFLWGLGYYPLVTLVTFFPWTLGVGGAASALLGGRLGTPRVRALLLGWLLPTPVLMTLVATKLPHYLLPIWPALGLAVAATLRAEHRGELAARDRRWLRRGLWWTGPTGWLLAAGLVLLPTRLPLGDGGWAFQVAGLVLAAATLLAVRWHWVERFTASCLVLALGMLGAGLTLLAGGLPAVERLKLGPPLAAALRAATPASEPVATWGWNEPSLVFYLDRGPVTTLDSPAAAEAWATRPGPGVLVLRASEAAGLRARVPTLTRLTEVTGYDFTKGGEVRLVVLGKP